MIKIKILLLIGITLLINNKSFSNVVMEPGDTLQKLIILEFNQSAIEPDREEYVDFLLSYDTSSFNATCSPFFKIRNKVLKVRATEYFKKVQSNGKEGLLVSFTPKLGSEQGKLQNIKIKFLENSISSGLNGNIDKGVSGSLITEFPEITYNVPMEPMVKGAIGIGSFLFITALFAFILTRNNMLFGKKTFTDGAIIITDTIGVESEIKLASLNDYSFPKQAELIGVSLTPLDVKDPKKKKGKHQRVARLQSTDNSLKITIENGTYNNTVDTRCELYHMDRVEISLPNDKRISIRYKNNKNRRNYEA